MQWREKVDVGDHVQAATSMGCGGAEVQVECWCILTAGVGLAASRVCSRAVEVLWRAVVGGRASTAVVVSWGREGSNALVVKRHVELAAFAQSTGVDAYQIVGFIRSRISPSDLCRMRSRRRDLPLAAGASHHIPDHDHR